MDEAWTKADKKQRDSDRRRAAETEASDRRDAIGWLTAFGSTQLVGHKETVYPGHGTLTKFGDNKWISAPAVNVTIVGATFTMRERSVVMRFDEPAYVLAQQTPYGEYQHSINTIPVGHTITLTYAAEAKPVNVSVRMWTGGEPEVLGRSVVFLGWLDLPANGWNPPLFRGAPPRREKPDALRWDRTSLAWDAFPLYRKLAQVMHLQYATQQLPDVLHKEILDYTGGTRHAQGSS